MNHKLWSSLTATVLSTALSTAVTYNANASEPVIPTGIEGTEAALEELYGDSVYLAQTEEEIAASDPQTSGNRGSLTTIFPHAVGEYQGATLYVRRIPLLTFVGTDSANIAAKSLTPSFLTPEQIRQGQGVQVNQSNDDPVWRATVVADRINQMSQEEASSITLAWNAEQEAYIIKAGETELVRVDPKTQLPDSTNNWDQDALQAANRLRRLLGGAEPLSAGDVQMRPTRAARSVRPSQRVAVGRINGQYQGMASWYGPGFHGRRSASGERFNQNALTAAHRTLPFGTQVRVTNLNNGRSVVVRINDRGPFIRGRIIDLSRGAASAIGMLGSGVAPVQVEVIE
ncbi:septal ring lytic transglycosylase RlpA family protein [Spirulina subsalsa]|uniref:septal ring lytic transglycosylase RlpA family protein n=1 Tax=Spirulina subsalsa TaxID=54311 RepID=UPI0002F5A581|nr:septal ring lytic transglycosylase RlpA family protein [Spirulina subsalsa]